MSKVITASSIDEEQMQMIYEWVDEIPFSKPKRNITRDFSDGVMAAEIIKYFFPNLVDLHSFPVAHSIEKKRYNWNSLNEKVFKRMGFQLSTGDISNIVKCVPDAIENVLFSLKVQIESFKGKALPPPRKKPAEVKVDIEEVPDPVEEEEPVRDTDELHDDIIDELREVTDILKLKIEKLEIIAKMKDQKLKRLEAQAAHYGLT